MASAMSERSIVAGASPGPTESPERADVRALADLLDTRFRVPGTGWRFGLDAVLGLVPGLGDVAGLVLSSAVILQAVRLGARGATVVRMVGNVGIDAVFGAIPLLGSVFDFAFKANTRNIRLLERHVDDAEETRARSAAAIRRTIIGAVLALVVVTMALVAAIVVLVRAVF